MSIRFRSWPFVVVFALSAGVALAQAPAGAAGAKNLISRSSREEGRVHDHSGTWMSLDVSPDGQTIVFDLLGDLYTLPIAGGKATRLTSGLAYDAQPRFSPDGKRIVFVSDRSGGDNLWIMTLDGSDTDAGHQGERQSVRLARVDAGRQVHRGVAVPDGLGGAAKLWMYHVDGGTGVPLIRAAGAAQDARRRVRPGRPRYIWYAAAQGDWQYNADLPAVPARRLRPGDRAPAPMIGARYGSAIPPGALARREVAGLRHAARDRDRPPDPRPRDAATSAGWPIRFSATSRSRARRSTCCRATRSPPTSSGRHVLRRRDLAGAGRRRGGRSKIPFAGRREAGRSGPRSSSPIGSIPRRRSPPGRSAMPLPSPDGKRLAFTALDRLYVMDYPSGTPRRVTNAGSRRALARLVARREVARVRRPGLTPAAGTSCEARVTADGTARRSGSPASPRSIATWPGLPTGTGSWRAGARRATCRKRRDRLLRRRRRRRVRLGPGRRRRADGDRADSGIGERAALHRRSGADLRLQLADGLVSFRWDGTDIKPHLRVTGPLPPGVGYPDPDAGLEWRRADSTRTVSIPSRPGRAERRQPPPAGAGDDGAAGRPGAGPGRQRHLRRSRSRWSAARRRPSRWRRPRRRQCRCGS